MSRDELILKWLDDNVGDVTIDRRHGFTTVNDYNTIHTVTVCFISNINPETNLIPCTIQTNRNGRIYPKHIWEFDHRN